LIGTFCLFWTSDTLDNCSLHLFFAGARRSKAPSSNFRIWKGIPACCHSSEDYRKCELSWDVIHLDIKVYLLLNIWFGSTAYKTYLSFSGTCLSLNLLSAVSSSWLLYAPIDQCQHFNWPWKIEWIYWILHYKLVCFPVNERSFHILCFHSRFVNVHASMCIFIYRNDWLCVVHLFRYIIKTSIFQYLPKAFEWLMCVNARTCVCVCV